MARGDDPCIPETLADLYHCLNCLSETQLKMAWFWIWALLVGYTMPDDLHTILEDCKCMSCIEGDTEILKAKVALLADYLSGLYDMTDIANQVKCIACLDAKRLDQLTLCMICKYLNLEIQ